MLRQVIKTVNKHLHVEGAVQVLHKHVRVRGCLAYNLADAKKLQVSEEKTRLKSKVFSLLRLEALN